MNAIKEMLPILKNEQDRFVLKLHKELYKGDVLHRALSEDADWIKEMPDVDNYFCLQLKTSSIDDVFNWMNYLIYLHKA